MFNMIVHYLLQKGSHSVYPTGDFNTFKVFVQFEYQTYLIGIFFYFSIGRISWCFGISGSFHQGIRIIVSVAFFICIIRARPEESPAI
jgi:hypothetical protein